VAEKVNPKILEAMKKLQAASANAKKSSASGAAALKKAKQSIADIEKAGK
jgi:hypothetical protein